MAAMTDLPMSLPGFHHKPSPADLQISSYTYNCLKDDIDQPEVTESQLEPLAALFVQHDVYKFFGLHLIHGHFQIEQGTIMLGVDLGTDSPGFWTKPVDSASVDTEDIHGHIYMMSLSENRFIAYEYRGGPSTDGWKKVYSSFFSNLAEYLIANDLTNLLGLQVLDHPTSSRKRMLEFVLGEEGTVMLEEQGVNHGGIYRVTGWSFERRDDGTALVKKTDSHATTKKGTHQVFVGPKKRKNPPPNNTPLITQLPNVEAVKEILRQEGII